MSDLTSDSLHLGAANREFNRSAGLISFPNPGLARDSNNSLSAKFTGNRRHAENSAQDRNQGSVHRESEDLTYCPRPGQAAPDAGQHRQWDLQKNSVRDHRYSLVFDEEFVGLFNDQFREIRRSFCVRFQTLAENFLELVQLGPNRELAVAGVGIF
jgi:hypothetical protein